MGKEQLLAALLKMQSKGRKYVFILDWREDTWQAAGRFSCASAGPAGNYLHRRLWFLAGLFDWWYLWRARKQVWEVSGVTNKYINQSALGHFSSSCGIKAACTDCPEKLHLQLPASHCLWILDRQATKSHSIISLYWVTLPWSMFKGLCNLSTHCGAGALIS